MRTIRTKEIDGKLIFVGFDKLKLDGNRTRKKVLKRIVKESVYSEVQKLGIRIEQLKNSKETEFFKDEIKKAKKQHKEKSKILKQKMLDLFSEEKTHFELRKNESVPSKKLIKDIKSILDSKENHESIEIVNDKAVAILNLVGKSYFIELNGKFVEEKITKIGQNYPDGHILKLSNNQLNINSDGNLKRLEIERALQISASKKVELEILGKTSEEALTEAQKWYNDEVSRIEVKYS